MPRLARLSLRLAACVLSLTLAAGCGNACLELADRICACVPDDGSRTACQRRARDQQDSFPLRSEDLAYCQKQIDANACDCNKLNTAEGREGCGVAYRVTQP